MIRIERRGVVYGEAWFGEEPARDARVDIVLHRHRGTPIPGARNTAALSIVTDLCVEADAIATRFDRDCRYKVRRADTKDGLSLEFIRDPESRLDEFRAFHDAFTREKSLPPADRAWLLAACRARQLVLACACRNGEALVWHASVIGARAARLEHSASCFRSRETEFRSLTGRANRWLHWQELLRFREMGLARYDWGGIFEDESTSERAGINAFKKSFGGEQAQSWDCTVAASLKGRAWLPLRDAWRRLKSTRAGAACLRLSPGEAQTG
jgi:hypothetical protein